MDKKLATISIIAIVSLVVAIIALGVAFIVLSEYQSNNVPSKTSNPTPTLTPTTDSSPQPTPTSTTSSTTPQPTPKKQVGDENIDFQITERKDIFNRITVSLNITNISNQTMTISNIVYNIENHGSITLWGGEDVLSPNSSASFFNEYPPNFDSITVYYQILGENLSYTYIS